MKKNIIRLLLKSRKISLGDIAGHLNCSLDDIIPSVKQLKTEELIRFEKGCTGGCKTCRGLCSDTNKMKLNNKTVIISQLNPYQ